MLRIENNAISLTRGDTMRVKISISQNYGVEEYIPTSNDVITFGLKRNVSEKTCLIQKTIPVDTMVLYLAPEDTKNLDFGAYVYDMQIKFPNGDVYTFIPINNFNITGEVV